MAEFLSKHEVNVEVRRISSGRMTVSEAIVNHAVSISADMVVAGAYSRGRLIEAIFGGVTRDLLKSAPVPIFLGE